MNGQSIKRVNHCKHRYNYEFKYTFDLSIYYAFFHSTYRIITWVGAYKYTAKFAKQNFKVSNET